MTDTNDSFKTTIGLRLRQARQKKGLTLQQIGDKIGSTKGYVANLEAGVAGVSMPKLISLSKMYGVDPAWVAGFRETDNDPYVQGTGDFITDDIVLKAAYLEKRGLKSDQLFCYEVEGNYMEPELYEGNFAIANMLVRGILDRDLYVLQFDGKYGVRWVGQTTDGHYRIESETNNSFFLPNCTITPEELTQIEVIGRVDMIIS